MAYSPRNYIPPEERSLNNGPVKNCVFYRNGDSKVSATKVVITKRTSDLDKVKDELTTKISKKDNSKTGYIRNIYTPNTGTRVTRVEDLENRGIYVAGVNGEQFLPLK